MGQLACLQYAHENGCAWNADVCAYAASNGHLNCLKYAKENGCPADFRVCDFASRRNMSAAHAACLEYSFKNGCKEHIGGCDIHHPSSNLSSKHASEGETEGQKCLVM